MRTIAILPVKSLGAAKQRLGGLVASGSRQTLARSMLSDVLAALTRVRRLDEIVVVTRDRTAQAVAARHGARVLLEPDEAGHSEGALRGVRHALAGGAERVLLVPGDTPLLDPAELDELLARGARDRLGAVVVPDRHGTGTNALLLAPPDAIVPSFGPGSRERHASAAAAGGVAHVVEPLPSLALDVDTPEDLAALAGALAGRRGVAVSTRAALAELEGPSVRRAPNSSARASAARC
ncbi:MAG: 2-phospho-L-lactate guanylyltransferase [Nocardioidaceae bacterium]